jgi:hypothetical protein
MDRIVTLHLRYRIALLAACLLLWSPCAFPYRPFDLTDADVVAEREFELGLGIGHLRKSPDKFLIAPDVVGNLGIAGGREIVLEKTEYAVAQYRGFAKRPGGHGAFPETATSDWEPAGWHRRQHRQRVWRAASGNPWRIPDRCKLLRDRFAALACGERSSERRT